jgi:hypothetical protein
MMCTELAGVEVPAARTIASTSPGVSGRGTLAPTHGPVKAATP